MRIRTIKPEFWQSEDLAQCSDKARLLAVGLLNYADDEGFFNANPALIQAAIFPFDTSSNITGMLLELSRKAKYVAFGEAEGKKYGQVVNFLEHQVISHPKASKIKNLCQFQYDSSNVPVTFRPEWKGKEGKGTPPAGDGEKYPEDFLKFWQAYPKKKAKKDALKAWQKATDKPAIEVLLAILAKQKTWPSWIKEKGQFIPYPATWLNEGRWDDEEKRPTSSSENI